MATFPSITPTYTFTKKTNPNVRTVKFGDGYQQRLTFGINQNPKVFNLEFNVSLADANVIESFLNSRAFDNESFDFTPPQEAISTSGTFVRSSGSKNAVITAANHGIALGDKVVIDFSSGLNYGTYIVNARTQNTFTIETNATSAVTGDVTSAAVSGQKKFICKNWNKSIPYNNRAMISCTFEEVFEV